ncbi:hypothetical protein [Myroides sp. LoEW2-1]|uniref:hypothetical protein n=1 Tax=Myroides sp. LoEW2-1 TaxID=2683192 RepID=UPI001329E036|nr:hypothetical protein [Myroides sp. LoEW2-1]MVX36781.1 hypothetical protein [Myroides sp. LoEW2-1]
MKKNVFVLLFSGIALVGCNTKQKSTVDEVKEVVKQTEQISFTLGKSYFVKNTFENKQVESLKIETQEAFDKVFSPAAVMGNSKELTKIDFNNSFVLAVIGVEVNKSTDFYVVSLKDRGEYLEFIYSYKEGDEELTFTTHPFFFIVVDKEHNKDVRFLTE